MRERLIIVLALSGSILGSIGFGRARADDFDDDFGTLPPAAKPVAAPRPAAPAGTPAGSTAPSPRAPSVPASSPSPQAGGPPTAPTPGTAAGEASPKASATQGAQLPQADTSAAAGDPYPPLDEDPQRVPAAAGGHKRKPRSFVHPTISGLIGGVHVVDASSAWPGTFRVAFSAEFFRKDGFTAPGDQHRHSGGVLNLNVTPIEHLELAATIGTYATENRTTSPEVVQVVGDTRLFAKGFADVLPWLAVGGDFELALLNGVGSIGVSGGATSVGLRASATADLRALDRPLPIIGRSNLRYLFDNSARLMRSIEDERYQSLNNAATPEDEYRHLLSAAERYALQVNRVDRIGASFGVEAPLVPHERVYVNPMLEWTFALPVNRQDYDCVVTTVAGQTDSCLAEEGFSARPSFLTLGLRVQPYIPGLAILTAVDIGTSGYKNFVRELAPQERYAIRIGLSYAYDPRKGAGSHTRIQRVEIPANAARGHIVGHVVDGPTGTPVSGAIVHFEGTSLSDVVTDELGAFRSAELAAGAQGMRIRVEGYREALCVAVLSASGGDVNARCELTPTAYFGALHGRIVDASDKPVAGAQIELRGPSDLNLSARNDGNFDADKLKEGAYQLSVSAEHYFTHHALITVQRGAANTPKVTLLARPATPQVRRTPKRLMLLRPIQFTADSAVIESDSDVVLAEVAEQLDKHPEITLVEVQGHLDDGGTRDDQLLSEQRAEAVRWWLIQAGVAESRLSTKGFGATRPLVPNITLQNRARNRRIELLIK